LKKGRTGVPGLSIFKINKGGRLMGKGTRWLIMTVFAVMGLLGARGLQAAETKITVLNPLGQPPVLKTLAMAPRLDTLEGKTIYVVDVKYPSTKPFMEELVKVLSETHPKTKWVLREKTESYFEDDPDLWKEIKAKGNGMLIAIGH
jgi:hypothetical protein